MKKILTVSVFSFSLIALLTVGAPPASAGSLTPPGAAADTMYTLTNLYNLSAGTTATLGSGTIPTTPSSVVASFKTLTEIYDAIVAQLALLANGKIANGVSAFGFTGTLLGDTDAAKVLTTATYPGTIPVKTGDTTVASSSAQSTSLVLTVPQGYYSGAASVTVSTSSTSFTAGNIKSGINLFGIAGSYSGLDTSDATAGVGDILSPKTAYVNGSKLTGTMPTNTLSAANDTVSAGYFAATTLSAVDSDLAEGNIKSGTTIFGKLGTVIQSLGDAVAANVLSGTTFSNASAANISGTMTSKTGDTAVASSSAQSTALVLTVPQGYYSGASSVTVSTSSAAFTAGNIKSGTTLFGVLGSLVANLYGDLTDAAKVLTTASSPGTYNAANLSAGTVLSGTAFGVGMTGTVIQSLGNAIAANVLSTATFSNASAANITGTMPTNTLSAANDTVSAGYYAATTLSAVDTDLAAGNIASGVTVFGIAGTKLGAQLLKTNQTICYDAAGSVVTCAGTGQDGAYLKGATRSYTDPVNSTITDNATGLMWKKCSEGLSGASCATGAAATYTWTNALAQCEADTTASFTDWRLPNVYELYSLVDFGIASAPFINGTYFPATQSNFYWSSTTYPANYTYAMFVYFNFGFTYVDYKTSSFYVRCVRG